MFTFATVKALELISALQPMYGRGEATAIVRMVMEERFGLTHTDLLLGRDEALPLEAHKAFDAMATRLIAGEPVQYVLGYAEFCGRRFSVGPGVLIPRHETEEVVRWALRQLCAGRILDLGTGCGCIAITAALECAGARVTGVDISADALAVAAANGVRLGANVRWVKADMLDVEALMQAVGGPYDLVVSNPPYVRRSEAHEMHANVLEHEPHGALFVPDDDALRYYRAIAEVATSVLAPSGNVVVELNSALAQQTADVFAAAGLTNIELRRDQYERWRMLRANSTDY